MLRLLRTLFDYAFLAHMSLPFRFLKIPARYEINFIPPFFFFFVCNDLSPLMSDRNFIHENSRKHNEDVMTFYVHLQKNITIFKMTEIFSFYTWYTCAVFCAVLLISFLWMKILFNVTQTHWWVAFINKN